MSPAEPGKVVDVAWMIRLRPGRGVVIADHDEAGRHPSPAALPRLAPSAEWLPAVDGLECVLGTVPGRRSLGVGENLAHEPEGVTLGAVEPPREPDGRQQCRENVALIRHWGGLEPDLPDQRL